MSRDAALTSRCSWLFCFVRRRSDGLSPTRRAEPPRCPSACKVLPAAQKSGPGALTGRRSIPDGLSWSEICLECGASIAALRTVHRREGGSGPQRSVSRESVAAAKRKDTAQASITTCCAKTRSGSQRWARGIGSQLTRNLLLLLNSSIGDLGRGKTDAPLGVDPR